MIARETNPAFCVAGKTSLLTKLHTYNTITITHSSHAPKNSNNITSFVPATCSNRLTVSTHDRI